MKTSERKDPVPFWNHCEEESTLVWMKYIWPIKLTLKLGKARLLTAMSQCPGAISKAETACFNFYDVKYESGKKLSPKHTFSQCLKTQKEDKKIAHGWNVDFLYYYDIF